MAFFLQRHFSSWRMRWEEVAKIATSSTKQQPLCCQSTALASGLFSFVCSAQSLVCSRRLLFGLEQETYEEQQAETIQVVKEESEDEKHMR